MKKFVSVFLLGYMVLFTFNSGTFFLSLFDSEAIEYVELQKDKKEKGLDPFISIEPIISTEIANFRIAYFDILKFGYKNHIPKVLSPPPKSAA